MKLSGQHGRIIKVNLSTGAIRTESYDETFAKMFLGGNGLAAKLIYETVPGDLSPDAPENALVFTTGPVTDTPVWGSSRGHVATISPYTNRFADSNYGGNFAVVQKRTGFDAIHITGKSPKPVALLVTEKGGELKDCSALWGKNTEETIQALAKETGKGSVCAAIGPAAENGVLFANIIFGGGSRFGTAGRGGMGTVMGAKNLKAIIVKGTKKTSIANPEALRNFLKEQAAVLKKNTALLSSQGTPSILTMVNERGVLCSRNNTRETFAHADAISGKLIKENYTEKDTACFGCPVACGKHVRVPAGAYAGESVKMPEYETLYALGTMMDNGDLASIVNGNHLCDLMGIDTISMGVTLAFVAECLERGIISTAELGGQVAFDDGEAMVDLIRKTALMEGVGKHLALGSRRLAEKFGRDAYKYLYTSQGLECAGHSARGLREMSLAYATSTRGGSHQDGRPNYALPADSDPGFEPQPAYMIKSQASCAVADSLIICRFTVEKGLGALISDQLATMVNLVTGWDFTVGELEKAGERIYNLERLINVRRGRNRQDDTLPYRVMHDPIPDGPAAGRYCPQEDLDAMLDRYYTLRGWDRNGIPTKEKLAELGLIQAAD
ncbi:MAG: aldehyde ferredoxin oxidoreductase family protein [Deltaproteobacteria bacterium]|nr:aldehyde ferredoxin oxidoreductase family protein [Candidatus Anaeroferrophillus wilburensis]MBN2889971.1 aldehyde ferredoxin oxidoreductase family protein [Deltaproteobacteria bacterium]